MRVVRHHPAAWHRPRALLLRPLLPHPHLPLPRLLPLRLPLPHLLLRPPLR